MQDALQTHWNSFAAFVHLFSGNHLPKNMCRVAVRNTSRARAAEPSPPEDALLLQQQLNSLPAVKPELCLEGIFDEADAVDLDAGERGRGIRKH